MVLKSAIFSVFSVFRRHLVDNICNYGCLETPYFMVYPMNTHLIFKYAYNNSKTLILWNVSILFSNFYADMVTLK